MRIGRSAQEQVSTLPGVIRAAFRVVVATALVNALLLTGALGWVLGVDQPRLARLRAGVYAVRDVEQAMLDQETGARAYLLIGTQQFLEPYNSGVLTLATANAELDDLVQHEPELAVDVQAMRTSVATWQSRWGRVAAGSRGHLLDPNGTLDTYRTVLFLNAGKTLFDEFRAREATLQQRVQRLLARQVLAQNITLGATAGLTLLIGVAAVLMALRRQDILRREMLTPIDALVEHVDRVRHGDLSPADELHRAGPAELRRLGVGVTQMTTALAAELAKTLERTRLLDEQTEQLMEVLELAREIGGSLSVRYILDSVGRAARQVGHFDEVTVWLTEADGWLRAAYDTGLGKDVEPSRPRLGPGGSPVSRAIRYGEVLSEQLPARGAEQAGQQLVLPMMVGARIIGVVDCRRTGGEEVGEEQVAILETLAVHAASALEAARLYDKTSEQASMDALTHLANRRRLDEDLALECERSVRYGRPLSFLMVDLDHFKQINDTIGHQRADVVLQQVGAILAETVRTSDSAYRYGGEELCVLVRETALADAALLAERLRVRIAEHFEVPVVTASIGVAQLAHTGTAATLVADADAALYRAKRGGRNRVELADPAADSLVSAQP